MASQGVSQTIPYSRFPNTMHRCHMNLRHMDLKHVTLYLKLLCFKDLNLKIRPNRIKLQSYTIIMTWIGVVMCK